MATSAYDIAGRAEQWGVEPTDVLQAERLELVKEAAPLQAMRDVFDARRKEFRNRIAALIEADKGAMAENKLERLASADGRYRAFLDDAEAAFARLYVLNMNIQSYTERINRGQALIRLASNEPRG